jgi:hypothetical protein
LKKTKSDLSETSDVPPTDVKPAETSEITKQQEPTEKPMSEFEKRRLELQKRKDEKAKLEGTFN